MNSSQMMFRRTYQTFQACYPEITYLRITLVAIAYQCNESVFSQGAARSVELVHWCIYAYAASQSMLKKTLWDMFGMELDTIPGTPMASWM